jgi:hypothetical protein
VKIAVDFDGTIVEHKYPEIGKELLFAFETLKQLIKQKHQVILWTYRAGQELDEAVEFCRENGVEFFAVNKNFPEEYYDGSISRKIDADVYIDDRNLGGFPGWSAVWQMLNSSTDQVNSEMKAVKTADKSKKSRKGLFKR